MSPFAGQRRLRRPAVGDIFIESKRGHFHGVATTGRFSFKTWETGETAVPEPVLSYLAREGFTFTVEGPATYERHASLRNPAAAPVQ